MLVMVVVRRGGGGGGGGGYAVFREGPGYVRYIGWGGRYVPFQPDKARFEPIPACAQRTSVRPWTLLGSLSPVLHV